MTVVGLTCVVSAAAAGLAESGGEVIVDKLMKSSSVTLALGELRFFLLERGLFEESALASLAESETSSPEVSIVKSPQAVRVSQEEEGMFACAWVTARENCKAMASSFSSWTQRSGGLKRSG